MMVEGLVMFDFKTKLNKRLRSKGGRCRVTALQTYYMQALTFRNDQVNNVNTTTNNNNNNNNTDWYFNSPLQFIVFCLLCILVGHMLRLLWRWL